MVASKMGKTQDKFNVLFFSNNIKILYQFYRRILHNMIGIIRKLARANNGKFNVRFKLVVNQHPEGTQGRSLGNFPRPWGYHSLDSPGIKSDNSQGGIRANNVYAWVY